MGVPFADVYPQIEALMTDTNPAWQEAEVFRGWMAQDQVRLNAAFALLSAVNFDGPQDEIECIACNALGDPNGYVAAVATETLRRIGTGSAMAAAFDYLNDRRFDDTLRGRSKAY